MAHPLTDDERLLTIAEFEQLPEEDALGGVASACAAGGVEPAALQSLLPLGRLRDTLDPNHRPVETADNDARLHALTVRALVFEYERIADRGGHEYGA